MTKLMDTMDSLEFRRLMAQGIKDNGVTEDVTFTARVDGVDRLYAIDLNEQNLRLLQKHEAERDAQREAAEDKYRAELTAIDDAHSVAIADFIDAAEIRPATPQRGRPKPTPMAKVSTAKVTPSTRVRVLRDDDERRRLVDGYFKLTTAKDKRDFRNREQIGDPVLYTWRKRFAAEDAAKAKPAKAVKVQPSPAKVAPAKATKAVKGTKAAEKAPKVPVPRKKSGYWGLSNEDKAYVRDWCRSNNRPLQHGGYVPTPDVNDALAARGGTTTSAPPALFQAA